MVFGPTVTLGPTVGSTTRKRQLKYDAHVAGGSATSHTPAAGAHAPAHACSWVLFMFSVQIVLHVAHSANGASVVELVVVAVLVVAVVGVISDELVVVVVVPVVLDVVVAEVVVTDVVVAEVVVSVVADVVVPVVVTSVVEYVASNSQEAYEVQLSGGSWNWLSQIPSRGSQAAVQRWNSVAFMLSLQSSSHVAHGEMRSCSTPQGAYDKQFAGAVASSSEQNPLAGVHARTQAKVLALAKLYGSDKLPHSAAHVVHGGKPVVAVLDVVDVAVDVVVDVVVVVVLVVVVVVLVVLVVVVVVVVEDVVLVVVVVVEVVVVSVVEVVDVDVVVVVLVVVNSRHSHSVSATQSV